MSTEKESLERAIRMAGGQAELERRLKAAGHKISQQSISLWIRSGRLPAGWALPIAQAIDFSVTPHELDRRGYPNAWDGLPIERARPLILELAA